MRRIKSKGMKPELMVRQMAHRMGYRYRLYAPKLPGKPDMTFPARRKIIEVRGCFWHQHTGCVDSHLPKSNPGYWTPKLDRNKQRDKRNLARLRGLGWHVMVIWECETTDSKILETRLRKFLES
jgi:DNA mismatch endonuclease (patch repair protein)